METTPTSRKVCLGIDWGTHSSKWSCHIDNVDEGLVGKIHHSTLVRIGDDLIFSPGENVSETHERIDSLKRIIINDPLGQSFWDADRLDTGTSLGEAVSFSICSLLCDAVIELRDKQNICFPTDTEMEIGFSLPNWLRDQDKKSEVALDHFRHAVYASCFIFKEHSSSELPVPGKAYSIEVWKRIVNEALKGCKNSDQIEGIDKHIQELHRIDNLKWRYLVESCAAGLPYLRSISLEEEAPSGLPGLGKLFVVDVGAGSTDVGYMLRTLNRQGSEQLHYFPPAATFEIAGNQLTDKVREYYEQQGTRMTWQDAENRKLSESGWHDLEFAKNWRDQICRHIRVYVKGIPDYRWLPMEVPLQVVVTGGSGAVPGLKEEIKEALCAGLKERDISQRTINNTRLINERLSYWTFEHEAEYARRAVSIGASDPNKPELKYLAKMDKMIHIQRDIIKY